MRRVRAMLAVLVGVAAACSVRTGPAPRRNRPNARASAVAWSVPLAGEPGALAADARGVVVTVAGRAVVALDGRGRVRWSTALAGASLGAPAIAGSTVAVPTGSGAAGGCAVLESRTGAVRWSYVRPGVEGVAVAVTVRRVLCVTGDGEIAGLDRRSGALLWRTGVESGPARAAVSPRAGVAVEPATGAVAVTARAGSRWVLVLRDVTTGRDRGTVDLGDRLPPSSPVAVGGGRVAVAGSGAGRDTAALRIVDARSARVVADVTLDAPEGFDPASVPVVAGRTLVVAARDGRVDAVDLVSGRLRRVARTRAPILDARPVVAGAAVVVADWSRRAFAFGLADGRPRRLPATEGWTVALAPGPGPGSVDVALRSLAGGRIEQWTVGR